PNTVIFIPSSPPASGLLLELPLAEASGFPAGLPRSVPLGFLAGYRGHALPLCTPGRFSARPHRPWRAAPSAAPAASGAPAASPSWQALQPAVHRHLDQVPRLAERADLQADGVRHVALQPVTQPVHAAAQLRKPPPDP